MQGEPPPGVPEEEKSEAAAYLDWMANHHFASLGYRDHMMENISEGEFSYHVTANSGLCVLRDPAARPLGVWSDKLLPEAHDILLPRPNS